MQRFKQKFTTKLFDKEFSGVIIFECNNGSIIDRWIDRINIDGLTRRELLAIKEFILDDFDNGLFCEDFEEVFNER